MNIFFLALDLVNNQQSRPNGTEIAEPAERGRGGARTGPRQASRSRRGQGARGAADSRGREDHDGDGGDGEHVGLSPAAGRSERGFAGENEAGSRARERRAHREDERRPAGRDAAGRSYRRVARPKK
jgi:hypothetical protein